MPEGVLLRSMPLLYAHDRTRSADSETRNRETSESETPPKVKVAIYARVSTADQNPQAQLRELRAYCKRRKFEIVQEYVDTVTGGAGRARRPDTAYRAMMAAAKAGKFKCVLVWRYDRFARSLLALIDALQFFNVHGVQFISLTEDIDTTTPQGRLFYTIVAGFAEYEREVIRERVKSGLANAKARGKTLGRPRDRSIEAKIMKLRETDPKMPIAEIARRVKRSRGGVRLVLGR